MTAAYNPIIGVHLCCLDEHGNLTGRLDGLEVYEGIRFTAPLVIPAEGEDAQPAGIPLVFKVSCEGASIQVGGKSFKLASVDYADHVGNMLWRGVEMSLAEARSLVEYLLCRWTPDEWSSPGLFDDLVDLSSRKAREARP